MKAQIPLQSFAQYSQDTPDFFDRYPVAADAEKRSVIIEEHRAVWLNRLATLDQDKALVLIKAYAPLLRSETAKSDLSAAYMKALAVWGHWSLPLPIDKAWSLGHEFRAAGIDEKLIPLKRLVLIITGTDPGPVPSGWDVGCSTDHVPCLLSSLAELDHQISELSTQGYLYFLIIDPRRRASVDTWQLVTPESEHATAPSGALATAAATVQRTIRQQAGIYFLDAQNKLIYRSRLDAKQSVNGRVDAPGAQAVAVMAKLRQAEDVVLQPAEKVVPVLLDQPISAVSVTSFNITQQISDDDAIFQHKNLEHQQQVAAENAHIASLLGLSILSEPVKPTIGTDLKLPSTMDCKQLRDAATEGQLKALWASTLGTVGGVKAGTVQNSFVFLESIDDISSLREAMVKKASQPDAVLAALKKTAITINQRVELLRPLPVGNAPAEASQFLALWLNQYAGNRVLGHAEQAIPHAVGQLYQVYHDIYNQRAIAGDSSLNNLRGLADEKLKEAVKLLAQEDASTVLELNAVTPQALSATLGEDLLASCGH